MKKIISLFIMFIVMVTMIYANGNNEGKSSKIKFPNIIIDGAWLEDNLDNSNLVILDTARKQEEYSAGHIKGALYADRTKYWSEVNGVAGMFPGVDPVVNWLEELGISNKTPVVIYDAGAGLWAARVAWTLAYLGHENWAVLDGGYALWEADGRAVESGDLVASAKGEFKPKVNDDLLVSGDDVFEHLDDPEFVVVDTRSEGEFNGTDVRAARGGHIPGSKWLEWTLNNSDDPQPVFLDTESLVEFYESNGITKNKKVATLCQTGVRGAHTWLALKASGYDDVALYDGSWAEWASVENYPVEE